jgi:predicted CoA-binding protein
MFTNPPAEQIELLRAARIIAIVGLSAAPAHPSHEGARQLQGFGYRIIRVTASPAAIRGERAVAARARRGVGAR